MIRVPTHRSPTHPGEMLLEEFLMPMALSLSELCTAIHVPEAEMQNLVHQQIPLTPSLGLRLAKYFGTSADFWINLQLRWDLYHTLQAEAEALEKIQPRSA